MSVKFIGVGDEGGRRECRLVGNDYPHVVVITVVSTIGRPQRRNYLERHQRMMAEKMIGRTRITLMKTTLVFQTCRPSILEQFIIVSLHQSVQEAQFSKKILLNLIIATMMI